MIMKPLFRLLWAVILPLSILLSCESEPELEGLVFDKYELTLRLGETADINVSFVPESVSGAEAVWTSSNPDIAPVSQTGTVSALALGEAVIMAECGSVRASCEVTVIPPSVEQVVLTPESLEMKIGETRKLEAGIMPQDAAEGLVLKWTSSDREVAFVDGEGTVNALKAGTAVITVEAGDVKDECLVTVTAEAPEVGDYYYSDGTWSSDLDNEKIVIGVVFWTGDAGASDQLLKADFPDCNHGLVVSVSGETKPAWQAACYDYGKSIQDWVDTDGEGFMPIASSRGTDNINMVCGYNNTKALEAFNADGANAGWKVDIIDALWNFREEVKAPAVSSGWYIPSIKELSLLCTGVHDGDISDIFDPSGKNFVGNRDLVNERLSGISGAEMLDKMGMYWSSLEKDQTKAWTMIFNNGAILENNKGSFGFKARFVLAF